MSHSARVEWWRPVGGSALVRPMTPRREPDSPAAFRGLVAFTVILLLSPQTYIPGLSQARIALLTGGFAVAAHCWLRFAARQPLLRFSREIWLAATLAGWAVATVPFSIWPGGSAQILLGLYLKALIIFWLLSATVVTLGRLRTVTWGLSLMAVPLAFTAVENFLLHREVKDRVLGYDAPLTANPNDLALMLNLILPLTVALLLISRRPPARAFFIGLVALEVCGIVVTFSRGGFLTLAATVILYMFALKERPERKWVMATLALVVALIPLLPAGYVQRLTTISNLDADTTGSAVQRWSDTRIAFAYVLNHPLLGDGLGMDILSLNDLRGKSWHDVHNVYLQYGMDLGWTGLGLFLLLLVNCIRTAVRVRGGCSGLPALRELSLLAEAVGITLSAFAVAAFFYPVAYHFYFYYFAGLAAATGAVYETELRALKGTPISTPSPRISSRARVT